MEEDIISRIERKIEALTGRYLFEPTANIIATIKKYLNTLKYNGVIFAFKIVEEDEQTLTIYIKMSEEGNYISLYVAWQSVNVFDPEESSTKENNARPKNPNRRRTKEFSRQSSKSNRGCDTSRL
jgi:hypothetical protein